MRTADTSIYSLSIAEMAQGIFAVLRFRAVEHISDIGYVSILAISETHGISFDQMIGKAASLTMERNGEEFKFSGIVVEFHEEPFGPKYHRYEILLKPRIHLLDYSSHCRVFQKKSVPEILLQVLKDSGYPAAEIQNLVKGTYPKLEFCVQYNESDLAFFRRQAEAAGIFWFYDPSGETPSLVLGDNNKAFAESSSAEEMYFADGPITDDGPSNVAYQLRRTQTMHTGKVRLLGYNYETPNVLVKGNASGNGQGEHVLYHVGALDSSIANQHSQTMQEAHAATRDRVSGACHCAAIRPGFTFAISEEFGAGFSGNYVTIETTHEGSQEAAVMGSGESTLYHNYFSAQPTTLVYRPPLVSPKPQVGGILTARVDGPDGKYAHLDDHGRYRARLPFDESSAGSGQASCPVRLAQPFGGPGYGMHLPLHKGADLLLAFEGGDVDHPIAIGTAPNPSQKSPVNSTNKSEGKIKTAAGHEITLDDLEDKTKISLKSAKGHQIIMDDTADTSGILIQTTNKHRLHLDDKNIAFDFSMSDGEHSFKVDGKDGIATFTTKGGHIFKIDDKGKAITLQSSKGHSLKLDDDGDKVTLQDSKGKHIIQIDGSGKIILSTEGDMEISSKGSLKLKGKDVSIQSESAAINIKSAQALALEGANVNVKAQQKIQVESGMDTGIKAGMNLKLEGGVNVESKAGVQSKTSGTLCNLEASGIATIKGAMVMVN